MVFDGQAFHPSLPASGNPIVFESVAHGHSRIMSFDPQTKVLEGLTEESFNATNPAITASGRRLAYISDGRLFVRGQGLLNTPQPVEDAAWFPSEDHLVYSVNGAIYDSYDSNDARSLAPGIAGHQSEPAVSPDGKWLVLTVTRNGIRHIWTEDLSTKITHEVTGGDCNSYAAAWELDSKALIFASDCGRGLGLPRLYRAPLL
jgi:Tol biopolymer transport system component